MKTERYILFSMFILCGILLFCSIFMIDVNTEDMFVTGKVYWLHGSVLFLAFCVWISIVWHKEMKPFSFSIADGLLLLWAIAVVLTYDWKLNPVPEKLLTCGQLLVLWFLMKYIFTQKTKLRLFFVGIMIIIGIIEAVLGILQLNGLLLSNHALFNVTGDFYNPGPFSGFLAVILPLCLWVILRFGGDKETRWQNVEFWISRLAWIGLLAIVIVLPAGMSRTAWIAAFVSCVWVYLTQKVGWKKVKCALGKNHFYSILYLIGTIVVLIVVFIGIYHFKQASADGRFFMWKIVIRAILESPLSGVGLGGFRTAYSDTQAAYFASELRSNEEMMAAGCPDSGFNEFLQIALEQGIIGLLLFVSLLGYSLYKGVKIGEVGAAGGLLSLIVFSFASYPLQLVEFWIVFIVLLAMVNGQLNQNTLVGGLSRKRSQLMFISILFLCSVYFMNQNRGYYNNYKKWFVVKKQNNNQMYDVAIEGYGELLDKMKHRPELLFETALCMNRKERYHEANKLLYDAMKLTNDPLVYYVAASNEQILGNYSKAEGLLLYVANMLPERIYPYYMLLKLYSVSGFVKRNELINTANIILIKEAKVPSKAVDEMKKYAKEVLDSLNVN